MPQPVTTNPASELDALDAILASEQPLEPPELRGALLPHLRPLFETDEGTEGLLDRVPRLVRDGFFLGTVWSDPARLLPPLVKSSLLGPEPSSVIEAVSELRVLAVALERLAIEGFSPQDAHRFLKEAVVMNLDLVQMGASEQHRLAGGAALDRARRVVALVVDRLAFEQLDAVLLREIEAICLQRRILTAAAVDMIQRAERYAARDGSLVQRRLMRYVDAVNGVTELARRQPAHDDYRRALLDLPADELTAEAKAFGRSVRSTGLAGPQHAVLIRTLAARSKLAVIGQAMGIDRVGRAELWRHEALVRELIAVAVTPATPMAIAGLAGSLDRTVLSQHEVAAGLRNLIRRPPCAEASRRLIASRPFEEEDGDSGALLLAGALAVLGFPLGVGQGDNPSCQSARGLSLWSQVAPGYFLELLTSAAFEDCTRIRFRGVELCSRDLPEGPTPIDLRLDPASVVLVPHLQRTYKAMLDIVKDQPGDPHRYVNPGLYGPWIPTGFECVFPIRDEQPDLAGFIRRFLAVHHPSAALVEPIHPRPLGLVVTSVHGDYLGLHAVSLQRVNLDAEGIPRAYFFNPNDDGRQNWGQGIVTSTSGHGEHPGESSLPLHQLASRIYAFHFHEHEIGNLDQVPGSDAEQAVHLAEGSWAYVLSTPRPSAP